MNLGFRQGALLISGLRRRDALKGRAFMGDMITRRQTTLTLAGCSLGLPFVSRPVAARFPAGRVSDISAPPQWLSERLGQQFIVENRVGAGGNLATESVVKSTPDGYTLLLTGSNDDLNVSLYDNLIFNYLRDIAPVSGFTEGTGVIVVPPTSPAGSLSEFISVAKGNPARQASDPAG
jgi:hypothetical protein